jgi:hypothetical protein
MQHIGPVIFSYLVQWGFFRIYVMVDKCVILSSMYCHLIFKFHYLGFKNLQPSFSLIGHKLFMEIVLLFT